MCGSADCYYFGYMCRNSCIGCKWCCSHAPDEPCTHKRNGYVPEVWREATIEERVGMLLEDTRAGKSGARCTWLRQDGERCMGLSGHELRAKARGVTDHHKADRPVPTPPVLASAEEVAVP